MIIGGDFYQEEILCGICKNKISREKAIEIIENFNKKYQGKDGYLRVCMEEDLIQELNQSKSECEVCKKEGRWEMTVLSKQANDLEGGQFNYLFYTQIILLTSIFTFILYQKYKKYH